MRRDPTSDVCIRFTQVHDRHVPTAQLITVAWPVRSEVVVCMKSGKGVVGVSSFILTQTQLALSHLHRRSIGFINRCLIYVDMKTLC